MLPNLAGRPLRVELRRSLGPHLAAASIPRRVIMLDSGVLSRDGEFERILVHEIFHFAWVRLSNARRREWGSVLRSELVRSARGELGWSAEWRKNKLRSADPARRTPAWRRYVCESFCDTAAWLYAEVENHEEFTLSMRYRRTRRAWFEAAFPATSSVPI